MIWQSLQTLYTQIVMVKMWRGVSQLLEEEEKREEMQSDSFLILGKSSTTLCMTYWGGGN